MFDITQLIDIANRLASALQQVKPILLGQPHVAAEKLADVLNEVSKIYQFVDDKLVEYLSISCKSNDDNLAECRARLLAMESGVLMAQGNEARGHCHKIDNIYQNYLERWFKDLINPQQQDELRNLFTGLGNLDSLMISGLGSVADWLTQESHETLNLLDDDKIAEANLHIKTARQAVLPVRRQLTETLSSLRGLQADFIAASGSTE